MTCLQYALQPYNLNRPFQVWYKGVFNSSINPLSSFPVWEKYCIAEKWRHGGKIKYNEYDPNFYSFTSLCMQITNYTPNRVLIESGMMYAQHQILDKGSRYVKMV